MGFFSRSSSASSPCKDALLGALKSVSLFSDQNFEYSGGYSHMVMTMGGVTGRLARYISIGKFHAGIMFSYHQDDGYLRLEITYDPLPNSAKKHDELVVMLPSTSFSSRVTTPSWNTDLVLILEGKASVGNLASVARKMCQDAADIIEMAG